MGPDGGFTYRGKANSNRASRLRIEKMAPQALVEFPTRAPRLRIKSMAWWVPANLNYVIAGKNRNLGFPSAIESKRIPAKHFASRKDPESWVKDKFVEIR